jgi:iron complex outermembrane receptor protein
MGGAPMRALGTATLLLFAIPGLASEPRSDGGTIEEMITVTGSRLRRSEPVSASPVTRIDREQILQSGRINLGDFLQTLPEQGNATNASVNAGGDGTTRIDLRGLGTNRTLVLVNGRRWVPGGLGANESVDLSSIPTMAIDHIDVLTDGEAAVYGSDAIAGVVNIVTRRHFDGSEVSAFLGTSYKGDGTQRAVEGTTGVSSDLGSILFSAGWYQGDPVLAGNRDYASPQEIFNLTAGGVMPIESNLIPAARVFVLQPGQTIPTATPLFNSLVRAFPTARSFKWDGSRNPNWSPFSTTTDLYNARAPEFLVTPQSRFALFSTGEAKIGSDARAYFEASFVQRDAKQQLAPDAFDFDFFGQTPAVSAQNIYNPFGVDLDVNRRLVEFGNRTFSEDANTYRFVAGLDGTLGPRAGALQGTFWDVSLTYGRAQGSQSITGALDFARVPAAVGPSFIDSSGTPRCGTPGHVVIGCVPLDLFHGPGSITPDQVAALSYDGILRSMNALTSVEANASKELFRLLALRPIALAVGYAYRFQAGETIPDPIATFGQSDLSNPQGGIAGYYYSNEAYAEVSIPLLGDLPGAQALELTGVARAFDYNTFGTGMTYQVGAIYRPVRSLTVRSTYSTAFRTPSIAELFGPQSIIFENTTDPCASGHPPPNCLQAAGNGDTTVMLAAKVGGNPALQPETASTLTGGVVWDVLPQLSLSAEYYAINISNPIQQIGAAAIISGCYPTTGEPNLAYCALIHRDPTTQLITQVDDINQNTGAIYTDGVDFGAHGSIPTGWGTFGAVLDLVWLDHHDLTLGSGQVIHGAGTWDLNAGGIAGTYPHFKGMARVHWNRGGLSAALTGRFIGSFKECGDLDGGGLFSGNGLCFVDNTFQREVSAWAALDAFLSYRYQWERGTTTAMLGVNNALNAQPPFIANASQANTDPTGGYDMVGRFVYARLAHSF